MHPRDAAPAQLGQRLAIQPPCIALEHAQIVNSIERVTNGPSSLSRANGDFFIDILGKRVYDVATDLGGKRQKGEHFPASLESGGSLLRF